MSSSLCIFDHVKHWCTLQALGPQNNIFIGCFEIDKQNFHPTLILAPSEIDPKDPRITRSGTLLDDKWRTSLEPQWPWRSSLRGVVWLGKVPSEFTEQKLKDILVISPNMEESVLVCIIIPSVSTSWSLSRGCWWTRSLSFLISKSKLYGHRE